MCATDRVNENAGFGGHTPRLVVAEGNPDFVRFALFKARARRYQMVAASCNESD